MNYIHHLTRTLSVVIALGQTIAMAQNPEVLPSIPGNLTYPIDINNQGKIVGYTFNYTSGGRAVQWTESAVVPLDGPAFSYASAINDSGVIVGSGSDAIDSVTNPIVWTNGVASILPTLGNGGGATDINAAGEVVGWVNTDQFTAPAVWRGGQLKVLAGFYGKGGSAHSIDDLGRISGVSAGLDFTSDQVPTQWNGDFPNALPTNFGVDYIGVFGVNKSGAGRTSGYQIVRQTLADGTNYLINVAIAWQDGEYRELQRPYGVGNSIAYGVNANGVYFGSAEDLDGYKIPTYWDNDGAVRLPLESGREATATAANESGVIVGYDRTNGLNPIPVLWRLNQISSISMPNLSPAPGQNVTLAATASIGGNPIVNQNMEFRVNDRSLGTVKTDANGRARMMYKVPATPVNRLTIMASLGGSSYVLRSIVVGRGSVVASVTPLTASRAQSVSFQATLRTVETNSALANREVSFLLRGRVVAKSKTNSKGVARATFRLPSSTPVARLPLEARFAGDTKSKPAYARATLLVVR
jgi:uncharacterized membrane protein